MYYTYKSTRKIQSEKMFKSAIKEMNTSMRMKKIAE